LQKRKLGLKISFKVKINSNHCLGLIVWKYCRLYVSLFSIATYLLYFTFKKGDTKFLTRPKEERKQHDRMLTCKKKSEIYLC